MKETVLVTGGAGYIGSHACKALAAAGYRPVVFDNLTTGHRDAVKWGPLETGDVRDQAKLEDAIGRNSPDLIMHFAGLAYVGESVAFPDRYYSSNVVGIVSLLQAMRQTGLNKIVFSSSCATYGVPRSLPVTEATPQKPISPYGFTKLICERVLADYGAAYGIASVCLRYFNAAGADPEGELGERHDPETHAIPLSIFAALGGLPFEIYGTDYETPDGSAVRDYVHVADLAQAHVQAADYLLTGGVSTALNLASGQGTSVLQIVRTVEQVTGRRVPITLSPRRQGDPPMLFADATAAGDVLRWQPRVSTLDHIVGSAVAWYANNPPRLHSSPAATSAASAGPNRGIPDAVS